MKVHRPNIKLVISDLEKLPEKIFVAAGRGMERGLLLTAGVVETEFLMGPRPEKLGVVTGRLKGSIATKVQVKKDNVIGQIGTNVPYGAYHEFGFQGTIQVQAYQRTLHAWKLNKKGAAVEYDPRRKIKDAQGNLVGYKESKTRGAERTGAISTDSTTVRAHSRVVNYRGRPFVSPALNKCANTIREEINVEIGKIRMTGEEKQS